MQVSINISQSCLDNEKKTNSQHSNTQVEDKQVYGFNTIYCSKPAVWGFQAKFCGGCICPLVTLNQLTVCKVGCQSLLLLVKKSPPPKKKKKHSKLYKNEMVAVFLNDRLNS